VKLSRIWAMPNKATFSIPPIRDFVRRYAGASRLSVDPFARNSDTANITNDLNPETDADHHMDALLFTRCIHASGLRPDLVILDPPYSSTQVKRCYESLDRSFSLDDSKQCIHWSRIKTVVNQMLVPGGVVLSFGWNSSGMGIKRGYEIVEILLVCHGSAHNDTICVAERKRDN
jgi:hypothetical protein